MCGIVGYIGNREAQDILVKGLSRLEYRGYDSAGIAIVNGHLAVRKKEGKIARLSDDLNGNGLAGKLESGIPDGQPMAPRAISMRILM